MSKQGYKKEYKIWRETEGKEADLQDQFDWFINYIWGKGYLLNKKYAKEYQNI